MPEPIPDLPFQIQSGNPYEPGSSLPGVAHSGGMMPTQDQQIQNVLQRANANRQMMYILANDPRALGAMGFVADGMAGHDAKWKQTHKGQKRQNWLDTDAGKTMVLGTSALLNSGMLFNAGGNSADLFAGIQNGVARGMRGNVEGAAGNQFFAGRGFTNDMVSQEFYKSVNKDFYNSMGVSNTQRTAGFDRGGVGQMISSLADSGAFAGMNSGTMRKYTQQDLNKQLNSIENVGASQEKIDAISQEFKVGTYHFDLDSNVADKVKDLTARALRTVRVLGDITGNKNVKELKAQAEAITGTSFAEHGAPEMIRAKLDEITTTSERFGLNPQEAMNRIQGLGGGPMAIRSVMDAASTYSAHEQRSEQADENGRYLPTASRSEIEQLNMAGMTQIGKESPEIMVAEDLIHNSPAAKGHETELRAQISKITNAESMQDKNKERAALAKMMTDANLTGGLSVQTVFHQRGGYAGIMRSLGSDGKDEVAGFLRDEDVSRTNKINLAQIVRGSHLGQKYGLNVDAFVDITKNMEDMDSSHAAALTDALKDGKLKDAQEAINKATGLSSAQQTRLQQQVADVFNTGSQGRLGNALIELEGDKANNPMMANERRKGDDEINKRANMRATLDKQAFGTSPSDSGNFIEGIVRGMAGGQNIGDTQALQYAENAKSDKLQQIHLHKDADGNYTANVDKSDTAKKILEIPGMSAALNAKTPEEVQAALHDSNNVYKYMQVLQKNGYVFQNGETDAKGDSVLRVLGAKDAKEAVDQLSRVADRDLLKSITGEKDDSRIDKLVGDGSKAHPGQPVGVANELKSHSKQVNAAIMDPKSETGVRWKAWEQTHMEMASQYLDQQLGQMQKDGKTDTDQYKALDKEKKSLAVQQQQGTMIGTVKLVMDDGLIAELHQSRGMDSSTY